MSHLKKRTLQTHPAIRKHNSVGYRAGIWGEEMQERYTEKKTQRQCNEYVCLIGEETKIEYFQNVL